MSREKLSQYIVAQGYYTFRRLRKVKQLPKRILRASPFDFLRGKAGRFDFPIYIVCLDELPVTTSEKIKKVELKKKYGKSQQDQI